MYNTYLPYITKSLNILNCVVKINQRFFYNTLFYLCQISINIIIRNLKKYLCYIINSVDDNSKYTPIFLIPCKPDKKHNENFKYRPKYMLNISLKYVLHKKVCVFLIPRIPTQKCTFGQH